MCRSIIQQTLWVDYILHYSQQSAKHTWKWPIQNLWRNECVKERKEELEEWKIPQQNSISPILLRRALRWVHTFDNGFALNGHCCSSFKNIPFPRFPTYHAKIGGPTLISISIQRSQNIPDPPPPPPPPPPLVNSPNDKGAWPLVNPCKSPPPLMGHSPSPSWRSTSESTAPCGLRDFGPMCALHWNKRYDPFLRCMS